MRLRVTSLSLVVLLFSACLAAQSNIASSNVPKLIRFSGKINDANGQPLSGTVGLTFSLYTDEQGGTPLWLETQNVQLDASGRYNVSLGMTKPDGLPLDLFASGEARWLGVQPEGQSEQPRVLLLAVPYALKAADAETVGGLLPSAFVLAAPPSASSSAPLAEPSTSILVNGTNASPRATVIGSGTTNYLPKWTAGTSIGNSVLYQSGTGSTAKIGFGTTSPAATLDVNGTANVQGVLSLPSTGIATNSTGFNSQPLSLAASAFNSNSSSAAAQTFVWRAEPLQNNTSNPGGTINLLFGSGSSAPAETGFQISNSGRLQLRTEASNSLDAFIHNTDPTKYVNPLDAAEEAPINVELGVVARTGERPVSNTWTGYDFDGVDSQSGFVGARIAAQWPLLASDFADTNLLFLTSDRVGGLHERIRIDTNGNLGLGTASPTTKLDVVGSLKLEGSGNGITFPDDTTQTTATLQGPPGPTGQTGPTGATGPQGPPGPPVHTFAACSSDQARPPACGCSHVVGAQAIGDGSSCQVTADSGSCSAVSTGPPDVVSYGICCVCSPIGAATQKAWEGRLQ